MKPAGQLANWGNPGGCRFTALISARQAERRMYLACRDPRTPEAEAPAPDPVAAWEPDGERRAAAEAGK
jgi:hypothetical protein